MLWRKLLIIIFYIQDHAKQDRPGENTKSFFVRKNPKEPRTLLLKSRYLGKTQLFRAHGNGRLYVISYRYIGMNANGRCVKSCFGSKWSTYSELYIRISMSMRKAKKKKGCICGSPTMGVKKPAYEANLRD